MALIGYIQVTRKCNQHCRFCSNPPMEKQLTLTEGKRLIDDLARRGYHGVILTGGEPTLSEHLPAFISYARSRNLEPRIVTNGQLPGSRNGLIEKLLDSGLQHIHLSIYSHKPEIVSNLTSKQDSLKVSVAFLEKVGELKQKFNITIDINTVINHYNADHLDEFVTFIVERFPFIHHFVFNGLDPFMNRVSENPDTIPHLWEFEVSLYKALKYLETRSITFRIERVPLCYMVEFAYASTETRKIVKGEDRVTHFLDDKGTVVQEKFYHEKANHCKVCMLNEICAGLYGVGYGYDLNELHPIFVNPAPIITKILQDVS